MPAKYHNNLKSPQWLHVIRYDEVLSYTLWKRRIVKCLTGTNIWFYGLARPHVGEDDSRQTQQPACICQYHVCWWPGDARSQVISRHDVDLVILELPMFKLKWGTCHLCIMQIMKVGQHRFDLIYKLWGYTGLDYTDFWWIFCIWNQGYSPNIKMHFNKGRDRAWH